MRRAWARSVVKDARERIEAVLLRDQATVIFIEHDARFVENVATKEVILSS